MGDSVRLLNSLDTLSKDNKLSGYDDGSLHSPPAEAIDLRLCFARKTQSQGIVKMHKKHETRVGLSRGPIAVDKFLTLKCGDTIHDYLNSSRP